MKTRLLSSLLFAAAAVLLAGCIKMPKGANPDKPGEPDEPISPPPHGIPLSFR